MTASVISSNRTDALHIVDLRAGIAGRQILKGVSLSVNPGEVHAIMGPNGSGKSTLSHVLLGRSGYVDISGSIRIGEIELLGLPTWQRAQAGMFLAMQYPIEVPGVRLSDVLRESFRAGKRDDTQLDALLVREARAIGLADRLADRTLNVDLSGGEKKRNETLQLAVLNPKFAVLDEIDSGLDVDAMRDVARRVLAAARENGVGVVAITHYGRLLEELTPDVVHVFIDGRIVHSGGPELVTELEANGYANYAAL